MSVKIHKKVTRINARDQRVEEIASQAWDLESRLSMIQMLIPLGLKACRGGASGRSEAVGGRTLF